MNIAVYCGSSAGSKEAYTIGAVALGMWIAENGHTLVYGCLLYTSPSPRDTR